jgi:hypothetical protein
LLVVGWLLWLWDCVGWGCGCGCEILDAGWLWVLMVWLVRRVQVVLLGWFVGSVGLVFGRA